MLTQLKQINIATLRNPHRRSLQTPITRSVPAFQRLPFNAVTVPNLLHVPEKSLRTLLLSNSVHAEQSKPKFCLAS